MSSRAGWDRFLQRAASLFLHAPVVEVRAWLLEKGPERTIVAAKIRSASVAVEDEENPPVGCPPFRFVRFLVPQPDRQAFLTCLGRGGLLWEGEWAMPMKSDTAALHWHDQAREDGTMGLTFEASLEAERPDGSWLDFEDLERDLRCSDRPWSGVKDVLDNFFRLPFDRNSLQHRSRIEVKVDVGLHVLGGTLLNGSLVLDLTLSPSIKPEDVLVGVVVQPALLSDIGAQRFQKPLIEVATRGGETDYRVEVPVRRNAARVQVFLAYHGWPAASAGVVATPTGTSTSSARAIAVYAGDAGLRDWLTVKADKHAAHFEAWVATLLHAFGMRATAIGEFGWDAPDIIAHAPVGNWTVIVEATTGAPNNGDKMAKLYRRAQELSSALGHQVTPVLATLLDTGHVTDSDRQRAADDGIVLLTRDSLAELADRVITNGTVHDLQQVLRPVVRSGGFPPGLGMRR